MSTFYQQLYSVGQGSVGPGTYVSVHSLDPTRSRGVITNLLQDPGGITTAQLSAKTALLDTAFPGTTIPLAYTTIRQLTDTQALIVATYSQDQVGNGGFQRVYSARPTITRDRLVYDYATDNRDDKGRIIPLRIPVRGRVIEWASVVYSDARPDQNTDLDGTIHSGTYTIDGYIYPAGSLLFQGMSITHEKYGAFDRWIRQYVAVFDPYLWKNESLTETPQALGTTYSPGPEVLAFPTSVLTTWPNLP